MTVSNPTPTAPTAPRRRRRSRQRRLRYRLALGVAVAALLIGAAIAAVDFVGVAPRVLGPYLERRASGHAQPIEATGRWLSAALVWMDRGEVAPRSQYPTWTLPPVHTHATSERVGRQLTLSEAQQLPLALVDAQPGDLITLTPGVYRYSGRALAVHRAGLREAPITLRALEPGTVTLEFDMLEGFHVSAPHWIFENLTLVGVCNPHTDCAHAFHVVGGATDVLIRNNVLRDFNAHIKINGAEGSYPDRGRLHNNQLYNTSARNTDTPVTPIDLVAANGWRIEENLIADFVKLRGDGTSYGAFAKGGGENNVFARNVVLCEHRLRGAPGRRVGLSLGGGGADPRACRNGRCAVEQERSVLRDNLIASCSDDGIYINRAAQTQLLHNTVVDTAGINVRFGESAAQVTHNWVNAPIVAKDGATLDARDNHTVGLLAMYWGLARAYPLPCTAKNPPWAHESCGPTHVRTAP